MTGKKSKPVISSKKMPKLFPVVGIGTSAGGLEALELFLSHVPDECGMAFVVIQHLSPDHTGSLPELLQRTTTMKVQQVDAMVRVEPDCVYVIPPNKNLTISNRILHLEAQSVKSGLRLPIDIFLHSLATDCTDQSIGVILSGMGRDGTSGMCSIKGRGGLTLVQEPTTAKFDSMPTSVIDSGCADIVAKAEELPGRIIDFLGHVASRGKKEKGPEGNEQSHLEKITAILKATTQHDFSLYKPTTIYRRVDRRMMVHHLSSIADYERFLRQNPHEVQLLFSELLIGVTSFFRDAEMWEELKDVALSQIMAAYPEGGILRAWSCGCSTGEEAYSLGILFREAMDRMQQPDKFSLQIFATDLDNDAIEKARQGGYPATIETDVSPGRLQRFFVKENGVYRIGEEIRKMVTFAQQNVIMDPPFTKLDVLICRNLLIYLSTALQQQLLPLFHYSLKQGGLLFLGSAETVGAYTNLFHVSTVKSKLFWRDTSMPLGNTIHFPTSVTSIQPSSLHQESPMTKATDNLQTLADPLILKHFALPTVLVNDRGDIVYISGRTGKYLEPASGKANMNIFAMIREELQSKLEGAFNQALQQNAPVTVRGNLSGADNKIQLVDISILKIEHPEALRGMAMVAFTDVNLPSKAKRKRSATQPNNQQIEELEQELLLTREKLRTTTEEMQSTHEELTSANEELQSTNEELQSTNEELTTSKEEMQSMNEELQSMNAEQAARLEDYLQVNNDMENLLNSTEIVTIFLDNQLQVRRFTSGVNQLFNLIPSDIGRPLADIVSCLNYPKLYDHVQDVLRKLISVENQVSTNDGKWFMVRIMPYRTLDKKIDGVVITFNDITATKKREDELREEISHLKAGQVSS